MSQIPAWFGRKFDFTFPVEQYPNLCVRLRGTPARLEEILRGVSRGVLLAKAGDNWSAQEHAGHLLDLESLWMARVDDFVRGGETLTVADLSNRKTYEANHNTRALIEILAEFRSFVRRGSVWWIAWGNFSLIYSAAPCCISVLSSPCVLWIICTLWRSTTTITWQGSGR